MAVDQVMRAGTETSAIIPEIWAKDSYEVLVAELPFNSLISTDFENEIRDLGDTVNIHSVPEFSDAEDLAEDARSDASSVTITSQQLVINHRIAKDFILTRQALIQSQPMMDKLKEMAIYSVMKKMQALIIAAFIPSASGPDHSIAYDSSTTLALADLLEVKELLDAQNVPAGDRHMVAGPAQTNDIFNITGFTSSDFLLAGKGGSLQSGQISAPLLGFLPHMTTIVANTSHFFHKSFMTLAVQEGMNVREYDLGVDGKRAIRVNVDLLFGKKLLDNKRCVTLS